MDSFSAFVAASSSATEKKRRDRPSGSKNKLKVAAVGAPGSGTPIHSEALAQFGGRRAAPNFSTALKLWDPVPSSTMTMLSSLAVAMSAPRPLKSKDRALKVVAAALGPLAPAVEAVAPPVAAPFETGLVTVRRRLATLALGNLVALGSHFLEFLIDIGAWNFNALRPLEAIQWVLSTLGLGVDEVALVEQSRPALVWPVDVVLGVGGGAVFSGAGGPLSLATTSSSVTASSSASSSGRSKSRCGSLMPMAL
jgi:hypothetical protein